MSTTNGQQHDDIENDAQEPEVDEGHEERIPAGFHNVRGVGGSGQMGFATSGTEQVSVEVEFVELADKPRGTTFLYFSEKAEVDSVKKLKAMGWDGGDGLDGIDKNIVRASVKYEEYQGKRRMKIDIFAGGRFEMKNQMNDQQKRGFFARLREVDKRQGAAPAAGGGSGAGGKGYPADWDKKGKPAGGPPRVNL